MDYPKSLKDEEEITSRLKRIYEQHISPLTEFVENIRKEKRLSLEVPYFDPMDGGTKASCLFLLEAPGPNAVKSGFISRNNPDETAKNMFEICEEIDLPRSKTVSWNIVPWYLGNGNKIRPANKTDIEEGWKYLQILLNILPELKVIVLVGLKAQKIQNNLNEINSNIKIIKSYHPSPLFINHNKENKDKIIEQLKNIRNLI